MAKSHVKKNELYINVFLHQLFAKRYWFFCQNSFPGFLTAKTSLKIKQCTLKKFTTCSTMSMQTFLKPISLVVVLYFVRWNSILSIFRGNVISNAQSFNNVCNKRFKKNMRIGMSVSTNVCNPFVLWNRSLKYQSCDLKLTLVWKIIKDRHLCKYVVA